MAVAGYVAELYLSKNASDGLADIADRARTAAESLAREGSAIKYRGAVLLPDDETCFCLYEADSADSVVEASRRAAISVDRVVPALAEHA